MHFDTLALDCFLAVSETGSFTKAADKVGRTQSAVSQQITKLENQIGNSIFIRGKNLTLTSEGEVLLSYAKKIIKLNREAIDHFKQPELQGEVRFGLPEDFASVFLSDVLSEYSSTHPRLMLNIECNLTLNLFERFKRKELDLVILKINKPQDFPNGTYVWSEPLEWVGNKEFFEMENFSPLPLVLSPHPCVYRARALQCLEKNDIKWRIVFSSQSYSGTIGAVKAGLGVTVLPRNMIPKNLDIIRVKRNIPKLDDTHICLLKHHDKNLAVNSFESFVIQKLKT